MIYIYIYIYQLFNLDLLHLDEDATAVLGVEEHHGLSMGANLGLTVTNHADLLLDALLDGGLDIWHLQADVMHATGGLLLEEGSNGALIAKGVQELQLGVGKLDEDGGDAVLGEVLGGADLSLEKGLVHLGSVKDGGGLGDGDGDMVEATEAEDGSRGGVGGE